jgi:hypothetical protein
MAQAIAATLTGCWDFERDAELRTTVTYEGGSSLRITLPDGQSFDLTAQAA